MGEFAAVAELAAKYSVGVVVLVWLALQLFKRLDSCTKTTLEITQQYHSSVTANTAQGRAVEKALDAILYQLEEL